MIILGLKLKVLYRSQALLTPKKKKRGERELKRREKEGGNI